MQVYRLANLQHSLNRCEDLCVTPSLECAQWKRMRTLFFSKDACLARNAQYIEVMGQFVLGLNVEEYSKRVFRHPATLFLLRSG
jgi:hypothetical protein